FADGSVERLLSEIDFLVSYGISKGITPPRSPKLYVKMVHIKIEEDFRYISKTEVVKKMIELVHELQDHECPNSVCQKQIGNLPVILIDQESIYLIVGKHVLLRADVGK
ncbi:Hypothetical predicted protein, partial [Paramuricea clavata]